MLSRRRFLESAAAALAVVACNPRSAEQEEEALATEDELIAISATAFPLGVSAGDATADRVMLWTRYVGTSPLHLRVVKRLPDGRGVKVIDRPITVGRDGFTRIDVGGLEPGARYRYTFILRSPTGADLARSEIGSFRTALAESALETISFGGVSCTHHNFAPFATLQHAATRSDFDFFLHVGDKAYCDGARSEAEYRQKYVTNWTSDGMTRLHRSVGWYNMWDDHEVQNDWVAETFDRSRLATARSVYLDHNPIRIDPVAPDRLWRSFKWGKTAEVFMLECRSERKLSTRLTPEAQYISRAQLDWLKEGLKSSDAVFKLIANPVPMAWYPLPEFEEGLPNRWQGFGAQREELLGFILANDIRGVFWLSGDIHAGGSGFLGQPGKPYSAMREIMMGPGGNIGNTKVTDHFLEPQWEWVTRQRNYVAFRADPNARLLDVSFIDESGQTIFTRQYPA